MNLMQIMEGFNMKDKPISYNVLLGFDSDKKVNSVSKALEVFHRLVEAGYSKDSAFKVIKETFLIDLRNELQEDL